MSLVVYVFGHVLVGSNFNFEIGRVLGAKIYNQEHDQLSLCGEMSSFSLIALVTFTFGVLDFILANSQDMHIGILQFLQSRAL